MQIDALRVAFSSDISKSFELKSDLGLRSPSVESKPTPPALQHHSLPVQTGPDWSHMHDAMSSKTISPSSEFGPPFQQPPAQPAMPFITSSFPTQGQTGYNQQGLPQISTAPTGYGLQSVVSNEQHTPVWDPSGIFSQWNSAFGPPAQAQQTPPGHDNGRIPQPTSAPAMPQQQQSPVTAQHMYSQQMPQNAGIMPTVTPVMWQNAFTDAYVSGHGHKRIRDDGVDGFGGYQKRRG